MHKPSRVTPLPATPALVRRTVTIAAVTTAANILGCADPAPVNYPPQRPQDFDPDRKVHPEVAHPDAPQADAPQIAAPQVAAPQIAAPQVAAPQKPPPPPQVAVPPSPPPQIPYQPTDGQIFKKN